MSARSDPSSPSAGPVVVLTMAAESAEALVADVDAEWPGLRPDAAAIEWILWPLLATRLVDAGPIAPVLARLEDYRWVVVPGPATIGALSRQMQRLGLGWPRPARVALVGPGSVATFRRAFGPAAITSPGAPPYDADHLIQVLHHDDPGLGHGRALVVNRLGAEPSWLPRLAKLFRSVDVLPIFEADTTDPPPQAAERLRQWYRQQRSVCWICGSVEQVERLGAWLVAGDDSAWALQRPLQVPHSRIADRARQVGFRQVTIFEDRSHLARGLQSIDETSTQESDPLATEPSSAPHASPSASPAATGSSRVPVDRSGDEGSTTGASSGSSPALATPAPGSSSASAPSVPTSTSALPGSTSTTRAPSPPLKSPPPPVPPVPPAVASSRRSWWPLALLLVIAAVALAGWWLMQQRFLQAERDSARRIQEAEARATRLEQQFKSLQDGQAQMSARSGQLETRVAQSADQQRQLQALYDELTKTRADTTFAEIEQSVLAASQHLQLNANVAAALMALQMAERRMGSEDGGERIGIRRLLAQDIERLKGLPAVDLGGAAGRLDEVIARVDRLALLSDAAEQKPGIGKGQTAAGPAPAEGATATPRSTSAPAPAPTPEPAPAAATGPGAASAAPAVPAGPAAEAGSAAAPDPSTSAPASSTAPPASSTAAPPSSTAAPDASAGAPASSAAAPGAAPASSAATPAAGATTPAPVVPTSAVDSVWMTLRRWFDQLRVVAVETAGTVTEEFRRLVTIRRVDRPEGLLLSPEQRTLARENLRLLLLNARLELLNREEKLFHQDLGRAIEAIERWFDTGSREVQASIATLRSLQNESLTLKVPDLSETLSAIRAARAASESRR